MNIPSAAYRVQFWLICIWNTSQILTNFTWMRLIMAAACVFSCLNTPLWTSSHEDLQRCMKMHEEHVGCLPCVCVSTDLITPKCPYESLWVIFKVVIIFIQWGETSIWTTGSSKFMSRCALRVWKRHQAQPSARLILLIFVLLGMKMDV